jgi:hypothetical protein
MAGIADMPSTQDNNAIATVATLIEYPRHRFGRRALNGVLVRSNALR